MASLNKIYCESEGREGEGNEQRKVGTYQAIQIGSLNTAKISSSNIVKINYGSSAG